MILIERILNLLRVLDDSPKAICLVDLKTSKVYGGNILARKLFLPDDKRLTISDLIEDEHLSVFLDDIKKRLIEDEHFICEDINIKTKHSEVKQSSIDFSYITDNHNVLCMIVKIHEDKRGHYIDLLLDKSKYPAVIIDYNESGDFIISNMNEKFCKNFCCSKENFNDRYKGGCLKTLSDEYWRDDDMASLKKSLSNSDRGVVLTSIKNARGDKLMIYYNTKELKPLLNEGDETFFCKLVPTGTSMKEIENPYTKEG